MIKYIIFLVSISSFFGGTLVADCKPTQNYLIVRPKLGLANRLRAIASATVMAEITNRKLVIDWRIDDDLESNWRKLFKEPQLLMFDETDLAQEGCSLKKINETISDTEINNYDDPTEEGIVKLGFWFPNIPKDKHPIIYMATPWKFRPAEDFLSAEAFDKKYVEFYKTLKPIESIAKAIENFRKIYDFDSKFMIGVHYRSWLSGLADKLDKNVSKDKESKYLGQFLEKMVEAVNMPLAKTKGKPVAFFLATDDPSIKEKLNKEASLKGRIFFRDIKIDRNTLAGQQDALVDWFLLGETNYIIGTKGSSFSDEAAHLTVENRKVEIGE